MKTTRYTILVILGILLNYLQMKGQVSGCQIPISLSTTNITASGATLSWVTPNPVLYFNVRYRETPAPNNQWIMVSSLPNTIGLANLPCNTSFEWQVQSACAGLNGAIILSSFSGSALFTTLACSNACPVPNGLYTNNITTSSAKLHWNTTGAVNYKVRYRPVNSLTWLYKYPTANNVVLSGLNASTAYEWQVRSKCTAPSGYFFSNWSNVSFFQTNGVNSCPVPAGLTSSAAGALNSRQLQWNTTGASAYNVRYKAANTASWTVLTSTTNNLIITGLNQNYTYEWQVQSACTINGLITLSAWSASAFFTTPSPFDLSPNPASDEMRIKYNADNDEAITLTIMDFMGMPVYSDHLKAISGVNNYQVHVSSLKPGIYYLTFNNSSGQKAVKFCIKR